MEKVLVVWARVSSRWMDLSEYINHVDSCRTGRGTDLYQGVVVSSEEVSLVSNVSP